MIRLLLRTSGNADPVCLTVDEIISIDDKPYNDSPPEDLVSRLNAIESLLASILGAQKLQHQLLAAFSSAASESPSATVPSRQSSSLSDALSAFPEWEVNALQSPTSTTTSPTDGAKS